MRIAVNTRFLLQDHLEGVGYYIHEIFSRIVKDHPEHEFIFIFDRPYDPKFIYGKNVIPVVAGPAARHPVLWKWWYDVKVPAIVKKYKADIFVSCDGYCSLTSTIKQSLVIHDLAFLHYPAFIPKTYAYYLKRYTPKFISKAAQLITVSEFSKKDIIEQYKTDPQKIAVIHNGAKPVFHPLTPDEKEAVKNRYTEGKEYFIYTGSVHPRKNLINLLKAFSVFKKKQKSSWKLVIAGRLAWKYKSFVDGLQSYKYRNDVIMTGYLPEEELMQLLGASYALVYPSLWEGFGVPVLEAMQSGVPVVTTINSAMQEITGGAALYTNPESFEDIADKMILLYKDERLRKELIEKGRKKSEEYSWDESAEKFWANIEHLNRE